MNDAQDTTSLTNKQVFTTGEAAKICKVSQQTIIRCFDSGRLQGFKVPGSRFRRIPRAELLRFMQHNDMDMSRLEEGPLRVLVVGVAPSQSDSAIKEYSQGRRVDIRHADDAWSSGYITHEFKPSLILLNPTSSGVDENTIRKTTSNNPELTNTTVVTVSLAHSRVGSTLGNVNHSDAIKQAVQQLMSA
ncbi:MAG: helix-turn-helix domain-containing protein [Phycisphaerales bacterium]|nr:helix-turn-helix domain-containing protein [Phycisphaerales bacterium]